MSGWTTQPSSVRVSDNRPEATDPGVVRIKTPQLGAHLDLGIMARVTTREAATLAWRFNGDRDLEHYAVQVPMNGQSDRNPPCNEAGVVGGSAMQASTFSVVSAHVCWFRRADRQKLVEIVTDYADHPPHHAFLLWRSADPIEMIEMIVPGAQFDPTTVVRAAVSS